MVSIGFISAIKRQRAWYKLVLHDIRIFCDIMKGSRNPENKPEMITCIMLRA